MSKIKTQNNTHNQVGYLCEFDKRITYYHSEGEGDSSYQQEVFSNKYIHIQICSKFPNITSIHSFEKGDKAYLVWIEYSTGNSFGSSSRAEVLPIALFKTRQDALDLKNNNTFWNPKEIYDSKKHQEYKGSEFRSSDGQIVNFPSAPWTGYFESLDEIHIEEVIF